MRNYSAQVPGNINMKGDDWRAKYGAYIVWWRRPIISLQNDKTVVTLFDGFKSNFP